VAEAVLERDAAGLACKVAKFSLIPKLILFNQQVDQVLSDHLVPQEYCGEPDAAPLSPATAWNAGLVGLKRRNLGIAAASNGNGRRSNWSGKSVEEISPSSFLRFQSEAFICKTSAGTAALH
jgi:hypothetical protein